MQNFYMMTYIIMAAPMKIYKMLIDLFYTSFSSTQKYGMMKCKLGMTIITLTLIITILILLCKSK